MGYNYVILDMIFPWVTHVVLLGTKTAQNEVTTFGTSCGNI